MNFETIDFLKKKYAEISFYRFKKLESGYKFDRWMLQGGMYLFFLIAFFFVYQHNFNLDYYECLGGSELYVRDGVAWCKNPFYVAPSWKNSEFLLPGKYGVPQSQMFEFICYSPLIIFGVIFLLNHYVHNIKGEK